MIVIDGWMDTWSYKLTTFRWVHKDRNFSSNSGVNLGRAWVQEMEGNLYQILYWWEDENIYKCLRAIEIDKQIMIL